jgi:predicted RNA-binding Zn-ribbon protein involved in translation (DUF1610 family)
VGRILFNWQRGRFAMAPAASKGGLTMHEIIEEIIKFMDAQQKAEKKGRNDFECPLCGGEAWWRRSSYNNHLHCGCKKCGVAIME